MVVVTGAAESQCLRSQASSPMSCCELPPPKAEGCASAHHAALHRGLGRVERAQPLQ